MEYTFIINPHSGKNRNKSSYENWIRQNKQVDLDVVYTKHAGHAAQIAREAIQKGSKNIIAVGGDGTMNEVATQLVGSAVNFGLIPMGSGNGFARSLNLPLDPKDALDVVFSKKSKRIDVGFVNDRCFFAVAGVGLDAQVADRFQSSTSRGPLPYFYLSTKEFLNYSYPEYLIKCNAFNGITKPMAITVANASQFGNGAQIAPQANLEDGYLDLCIVEKSSILLVLMHISKLFNGKIADAPFYSSYKSQNIEISSKAGDKMLFHTDGEPHTTNGSVHISIKPQALSVLVN